MSRPRTEKQRKAILRGYARQRALHKVKKKYPSRSEAQLGQAIEKSGLRVIEFEYEVQEDDGLWCAWFDVAVHYKGKMCFIDLDLSTRNTMSRRRAEIKQDYCDRHGIPLLLVKPGSVMEMLAQIEYWKIMLT
jgi:hypothetical protein